MFPRRQVRRRVRHVVRQRPRRRPLRRRVQARERRRHLEARRRAGARRRRPRREVLDAAAPVASTSSRPACIPVLNPSNVQDYLDLGLHGFAMSRYSGCWIAFKCVTDVVESGRLGRSSIPTASRSRCRRISSLPPRRAEHPLARRHPRAGSAHPRLEGLRRPRLCARQRPRPHRLGFAEGAARHRHHRQILRRRHAGARRPGHRQRTSQARHRPARLQGRACPGRSSRRARGASPKAWKRSWWSRRSASSSSTRSRKSSTTGRKACARRAWSASSTTTASGAAAKASPPAPGCCRRTTSIRPAMVARAIAPASREARHGRRRWAAQFRERLAFLDFKEKVLAKPRVTAIRQPYFCSGCPHNTSTRVPEGSRATAGIGCHFMAVWMDRNTVDLHPHGRRRRAVDRPGAVHRREAHLRQPRRRHLLPLRASWRSAPRWRRRSP